MTCAPSAASLSVQAPGHDAEVVGDETFVFLDFGEIGDYAKRT